MMKLSEEEVHLLKTSLIAFVRRVAAGVGSSPEEVKILPEVIGLLLGSFAALNDRYCRAERVAP